MFRSHPGRANAVVAAGARQAGFSLIELMVTVAVAAILAVVAFPNLRDVIDRNRLTSAANEIVAALQLARMESVRRNRVVEACPTANGTTCSGTDWSRFVVRVPSENVAVRDVRVPGAANVAITSSANVASNHRIGFDASGLARVGTAAEPAGTISVCSTRLPVEANTRDVQINASRVSVLRRNGTAACIAAAD